MVLPVRVMLLKRTDVAAYKRLMALQTNWEEREGTPDEERIDRTVVR